MSDKLMTVEEVAEYLRVKVPTVYEWAKEGKIPAAKVGRLWRFERDDIDAWVQEQKSQGERRGPSVVRDRESDA